MRIKFVYEGIKNGNKLSEMVPNYFTPDSHAVALKFTIAVPVDLSSTVLDDLEKLKSLLPERIGREFKGTVLEAATQKTIKFVLADFDALIALNSDQPTVSLVSMYGNDVFACSEPVSVYSVYVLIKCTSVTFVDTVPTLLN